MIRKLLVVSLISVICLAGCSNGSDTLYTTDGVVYNNKKAVPVTEHGGTTAKSVLAGGQYDIEYCFHEKYEDCPNNGKNVIEGNVTVFDKKKAITYFSTYLNSEWTVHRKMSKGFMCGSVITESEAESNLILSQMSAEIMNMDLSIEYTKAVMDNCIEVTNFPEVRVRPNEISVPGMFKIVKDTIKTDKTAQVGEITVGFVTKGNYDYYQWNEYVVKAQKGYDISQCITFKPKK